MAIKNVIIIQSDKTILLDTHSPHFDEVRKRIVAFSELVKTPEHMHSYRITPISLWNAAANGVPLDHIQSVLEKYKKYDIPKNVTEYIKRHYSAYGQVVLDAMDEDNLRLEVKKKKLLEKSSVFLKT